MDSSYRNLNQLKADVEALTAQISENERRSENGKALVRQEEQAISDAEKEMLDIVKSVIHQGQVEDISQREFIKDSLDKLSNAQRANNRQMSQMDKKLKELILMLCSSGYLDKLYTDKNKKLEEKYAEKENSLIDEIRALERQIDEKEDYYASMDEELQQESEKRRKHLSEIEQEQRQRIDENEKIIKQLQERISYEKFKKRIRDSFFIIAVIAVIVGVGTLIGGSIGTFLHWIFVDVIGGFFGRLFI